jgi:hypothetical protein
VYLEPLTQLIHKPRTDDRGGKRQERLMCGQLSLESNSQLAEACKPAMRALNDPTVFAKPLATLDAFSCNAACDSASPQIVPALLVVIPFVRVQFAGPPTRSSTQPPDRWQCVQAFLEQH